MADDISGIYKITNKVNGKFYIGSAVSFRKRVNNHKASLRKEIHFNQHLQSSWKKHSEDNFEFELISTCPKEYLIKMEQWFIDNLKPAYNISPTAGSIFGTKRNQKSKAKISKSLTGRKASYDHIKNSSFAHRLGKGSVMQYDKNMNFIKKWDMSITQIADEMKINRRLISECLNKRLKTGSGCIWINEVEVLNER